MAGNLYQQIETECEAHISTALQSLVGQILDFVIFLSLVERCWQDLCDQILMIRGIALYLDRTYVKQTKMYGPYEIWAYKFFANIFYYLLNLNTKLLGEAMDRTLLNHLLKMFTALGIYAESFEKPFLECTSEFYAAEDIKYMQQSDVPDYLKHVETRLQEEHDSYLIYLDASTRKPLIATAEKQLLERHITAILDKFDHSISDNIGETEGEIGGHFND
ncbi:hypothetical protein Ahy_A07g035342 [Arachis hypogaea]|uniref:Cullin N-terminal domain-containing protein n=1 Tax=Arachis hypogaea TaxID=3818 RepID=A0A445CDW8_ARAHY|nr:hypothetical protein Ahy_A07g035342 [Arachis hypogaea]